MRKLLSILFFTLVVCTQINAQSITSVLLPQFIQGNTGVNSNRIPFACRMRLDGLSANATYRFINQIVISADAATQSGSGNCIFASAGSFALTTKPDLSKAGGYGSFITDAAGSYEGWFITEPTGNKRFVPGAYIFMRINLNDGAGGTTAATYLTTADSVRVVKLDPSSTDSTGTGIRCTGSASPMDFIFMYDNISDSGRPISGSFIESDGTANTVANNYTSFYGNNVDGVNGAFGMVLPNTLPNGIQRVERRSFATGAIVDTAKDADGIWPSGASTINPSGGTTEIILAGTDLLSYSLSIIASHGKVTKNPDQPNYQYGTSVQLTPLSDTLYHFVTWSGDVTAGHETDNPLTVIMNQNRSLTASFALNTFSPTLILPTDSNVTSTTALLGARIISNGNNSITEHGVVWSLAENPTTADNKVVASDTMQIFTVPVTALPVGTFIHFRGYAINGIGTGYSPEGTFYTLSTEPSAQPGSLKTKAISSSQINLTWSAAAGANGYIIFERKNVDPVALPIDAIGYIVGGTLGNGTVVAALVTDTAKSANITGLTAATSYHYAIFPFAWDGSHAATCNYKTDGTVQKDSAVTPEGPQLKAVIIPQYIQGKSPNSNRIPFAYRGRITGLLANTTYRFANQVVISSEPDITDGAGNCIYVTQTGDFVRTSSPALDSAGTYGTLKTDSAGAYEGWFVTEPTGNYRFAPGKFVFMRVWLNDGISGTTAVTHATMADSVRVVKLDPALSDSTGTGLRCTSAANPKDFIFVYDNTQGTGRPISGSFIENDGTDNSVDNNYSAFYANKVNGVDGAFGVVVPNILPNGIRRVERRSLATGATMVFATDDNGVWPSGVNTVNPSGGTTELVLAGMDVQWKTGVETAPVIPKDFALYQNYPNPFNPTTTIEFTVPNDGRISLKIFDILGREVATAFEGDVKAGYIQKAVLDASRLSSGVYFSRLQYGDKSLLKKIVLLK